MRGAFVNDDLGKPVLDALDRYGVRLVALRSAGFNNVDLEAAGATLSIFAHIWYMVCEAI